MNAKSILPVYADETRRDLTGRLSKIQGQLRGIARMLEEDRSCVEVLQQLASTQAALRSATKAVLRNYLERCATDATCCKDPEIYDQLMETIYKFVR